MTCYSKINVYENNINVNSELSVQDTFLEYFSPVR